MFEEKFLPGIYYDKYGFYSDEDAQNKAVNEIDANSRLVCCIIK